MHYILLGMVWYHSYMLFLKIKINQDYLSACFYSHFHSFQQSNFEAFQKELKICQKVCLTNIRPIRCQEVERQVSRGGSFRPFPIMFKIVASSHVPFPEICKSNLHIRTNS